ncbi:unnamed protein product [Closterium sp. NIES-53]
MVDHEGRPIQFDTWLDDLQLYLLSDSQDNVLLFVHTSGTSLAPPATADSATRSQWLTRDAAARLAIRNHLPLAECAHFRQHKTAKALYDAVVARYSSPATAALGRLILSYLFPELSAFATVEDLITHLHISDARYRAALPAEDHSLALDPTDLTIDLLEQHHLAAETSVVAIGAGHGTPRTPFFEGCSPSPLAPSYTSAVAVAEDVRAASASGKRRNSKGKHGHAPHEDMVTQLRTSDARYHDAVPAEFLDRNQPPMDHFLALDPTVLTLDLLEQHLLAAETSVVAVGAARGTPRTPFFEGCSPSPLPPSYTSAAAVEVLGDERPHSAVLLRSGVAIFDLDYDAILAAMYALSVSAEGDYYLCAT